MIDSKWIANGTEKEIKATVEYKCIKLLETKENSLESKRIPKKVWPLKIKVSRISKFFIKRDCAYILTPIILVKITLVDIILVVESKVFFSYVSFGRCTRKIKFEILSIASLSAINIEVQYFFQDYAKEFCPK